MATQGIIHLIDDEPIIHDVLGQLLTSEGYEVEPSSSGEEALSKISSRSFDLILLDLLMPGLDGIEVLKRIKHIDPQAVVIIITAYASVESAIAAMKTGAFDYVQKPFKHDDLLMTIERGLEHKRLKDENARLKDELRQKFGFDNIIGKSEAMKSVFEVVKAAAPTRSTILLQGESGTGKELVARAIHQHSERAISRSSPSTAAPFRRTFSKATSSATSKGLSPAPSRSSRGCSKPRTKGAFSSMKSHP